MNCVSAYLLLCFVRVTEARRAPRRAAAQSLVEYSLILVLVTIVIVAILALVGRTLCTNWYQDIANRLLTTGSDSILACP